MPAAVRKKAARKSAGTTIGSEFRDDMVVECSPLNKTKACGVKIYDDSNETMFASDCKLLAAIASITATSRVTRRWTGGRFTLDDLDNQLRDMVSSRFADALGASKIPALDLAGNYDQLSQYIMARIQTDFQPFGLSLVNLFVENISLPPEVEAALDDTNIGRFTGLLRRFADRAQFIVITHQKRTMEAADVLYGVTMGPDGISQIVSRRLPHEEEAAATA